jgi:hypothetical protein
MYDIGVHMCVCIVILWNFSCARRRVSARNLARNKVGGYMANAQASAHTQASAYAHAYPTIILGPACYVYSARHTPMHTHMLTPMHGYAISPCIAEVLRMGQVVPRHTHLYAGVYIP